MCIRDRDIPDTVTGQPAVQQNDAAIERKTAEQIRTVQNYASAGKTDAASGIGKAEEEQKPLSAADRIDKFYTFNRKNEEFQQLLNREYENCLLYTSLRYLLFILLFFMIYPSRILLCSQIFLICQVNN